jgi:hypothetical protein
VLPGGVHQQQQHRSVGTRRLWLCKRCHIHSARLHTKKHACKNMELNCFLELGCRQLCCTDRSALLTFTRYQEWQCSAGFSCLVLVATRWWSRSTRVTSAPRLPHLKIFGPGLLSHSGLIILFQLRASSFLLDPAHLFSIVSLVVSQSAGNFRAESCHGHQRGQIVL